MNIDFTILAQDPGPALGVERPRVLPTTLLVNPAGRGHRHTGWAPDRGDRSWLSGGLAPAISPLPIAPGAVLRRERGWDWTISALLALRVPLLTVEAQSALGARASTHCQSHAEWRDRSQKKAGC